MAVGLLPTFWPCQFARLEPYGMMILIALLLFLPMLGAQQMGIGLNAIWRLIETPTELIVRGMVQLTGSCVWRKSDAGKWRP